MMGSLFAMSVAALLVVGAQFWYIIVRLIMLLLSINIIIIDLTDDGSDSFSSGNSKNSSQHSYRLLED